MKKFAAILFAMALILPSAYSAKAYDAVRIPLAVAWDMDGEAADDNQVFSAETIVDDGTSVGGANYTLLAQPDTCRVLNLTLVDTDLTAGTLTVTGTDCWGDALVCTFAFTAGDDTGVQSLTWSSGSSTQASPECAFASVTSVTTGTMTGESDETFSLGYAAINSDYSYVIYGVRTTSFDGRRWVDPHKKQKAAGTVTLNGTAVASFASVDGGAFQNLAVGDLVYFIWNGREFERRLTAVASDDAATINAALPSNSAPDTDDEVAMYFRKRFILVEDGDAWINLAGYESFYVVIDISAAGINTGGTVSSIECTDDLGTEIIPWVQVDTDTVATTTAGQNTTSVDLRLTGFRYCRVGLKFGTGDDDDTGTESIDIYANIVRRD